MTNQLDPIVGCYVLHLYCTKATHEYAGRCRHEFTGKNETDALKEARKAGWIVNKRNRSVTCPKCMEKLLNQAA